MVDAEAFSVRKRFVRADSWPRFYRSLAVMFGAGIQLRDALPKLYTDGDDPELERALRKVGSLVDGGAPISESLDRCIANFSAVNKELIRLGEETGTLSTVLDQLADYEEARLGTRKKVTAALSYPALQTTVALTLLLAAPAHFQETMEQALASFDKDVPAVMQILFPISQVFNVLFFPVLVLGLALYLARNKIYLALGTNPKLESTFEKLRDRLLILGSYIPGVGYALHAFAQERFTRSLALQLSAGRDLVSALRASFRTTGNPLFRRHEKSVVDDVLAGETLGAALRKTDLFDKIAVLSFVESSEESGDIATALQLSCNLQAKNIDANLETATNLLEPMLLALVGCFIGGLLLVFFKPLMQLVQTL